MKKSLLAMISLAVVVSVAVSEVGASFSKKDVGTTTAQFLKLGAGARATGMGDCFGAIADDATAVYWNPAGLSQLEKKDVSVMHAVWFEDIFYDWASYVQPIEGVGTFGIGVQYLSYGSVKEMDSSGVEGSTMKPNDMAATLSYASKISEVMIGVNVKYISSKITETATAFAGDIGLMKKFSDNKISIGLAAQNIGSEMKFVSEGDPLPMNIKLGTAYKLKDNWILAVDINAPIDNELNYGAGTEYSYKMSEDVSISGRAGYNTKAKDVGGLGGLTAGLGGDYKGYRLDYAFVPFGDLGDTHRVSVGMRF